MMRIGEIVEGVIMMNNNGSAYLVSDDLEKDLYIHKTKTNKSFHLDKVKVKIKYGHKRDYEGEVIDIIGRNRTEFVGVIDKTSKHCFFIPDNIKYGVDFYIPSDKINKAKDGQKVVVKFIEWGEGKKSPNGEVIKILGEVGESDTEMHAILEEYGLPYEFPDNVLKESELISSEIPQSEIDKRKDLRGITTITIDPHDAKDFDDALSVEWVDGFINVGVHIADVTHYLKPDTNLDKEAFNRSTSYYLVDRCIPMLPEILSNGLCSLRPNEDKLCFSVIFKMDSKGKVIEEWYGKTIINSDRRYTYEEAQEVIEKNVKSDSITDNIILDLNKIAKILRKKRLFNGSITFDKQEVKFKLDEFKKPLDIIFKISKDSNKLIEEFMLLANKHVAQLINSKNLPSVNRSHEKPTEDKLENLKQVIKQFDSEYDIVITTPKNITKSLNKLLLDIKGKPEENLIETLVIRSMSKANYSTKNIGHYGLGFKDYIHFTSPIRRYADVLIHRILESLLNNKTYSNLNVLETMCSHISSCEVKAQRAERDSIKYMQCLYLSDKLGITYKGMVTSITEYGFYVEIEDNKCEGMVRLTDIGKDTYVADVTNHTITGHTNRDIIRLGDIVEVYIKSINIEKKEINLSALNFK
jgi:ribonuclease R